jgi:hypothetical protein
MSNRATLDVFDLREWFAQDPLGCVADCAAQNLLRAQEFPYRHWRPPRSKWSRKSFWEDLADYLRSTETLGDLASRFADFLVGYLLVVENQTPGRAKGPRSHDPFRPLRKILGAPRARANPQRRESLKSVITRAMADDLCGDYGRKNACEIVIPKAWKAVGVASDGVSLRRTERRARNKRSLRTP